MITIRKIAKQDNLEIAKIIREALEEHQANKPGTVYDDPTTDDLYTLFKAEQGEYWVAIVDGDIIGGCGYYLTPGLPSGTAELVKLYIKKDQRGKGIGKLLIENTIEHLKNKNYKKLYLESMPELSQAIHLYEKFGFTQRTEPLGNSGHFACDLYMELEIKQ